MIVKEKRDRHYGTKYGVAIFSNIKSWRYEWAGHTSNNKTVEILKQEVTNLMQKCYTRKNMEER